MDQYRGRRLGNYDDDGDVKVDDRLSNGATVGDGGGYVAHVAFGSANIAEAAADADCRYAVRRGRSGVPVPPAGMNSTFSDNWLKGLQMVHLKCPRHSNPSVSSIS